MARIESDAQLRKLYKAPTERVRRKQLDRLDQYARRFIGLSPFLVLASSTAAGGGDASPRGDAPGFVQVLDERTLLIPDRPGNNRTDSLNNLLANPEVGLIFFVPGIDETLRVNGSAEIRDDAELCARCAVEGRRPATVLAVAVREVFFHCGKALMRARLWNPQSKVDRAVLPSIGQIINEQVGLAEPGETQDVMVARYRETLY
jgi:PPOX class probable FMN-dependent enzyme